MIAIPIIPGRLYRVRVRGLDLAVIADHPCGAILAGLAIAIGISYVPAR